ncbi:MAG: DUF2865 domain-containing protein [Xanthobacteraceae bacterium]
MLFARRACPNLRTAFAIGVLSASASLISIDCAFAQGFFDFLFGGFRQQPAQPQQPNAYPPPPASIGRVAPAPLGQESVTDSGGGTNHPVAYCVRLCDGQHFPMEHMVNGTPVETCRAICPYSKTKVFFGTEISDSVAQDGQHYTDLDAAFAYRKQLMTTCTCNGKNAWGLNKLDVNKDPTLRPGDIVSTKEGLMAFTGRTGTAPGFAPVNPATLPDDIRPGSPQLRLPATAQSTNSDEPGTVVAAPNRQSQPGSSAVDSRDRSTR